MNSLALYLLLVGISVGILLLPYRLWFSKLPYFRLNRGYLLAVLGVSLMLPPIASRLQLAPDYTWLSANFSPGYVSPPVPTDLGHPDAGMAVSESKPAIPPGASEFSIAAETPEIASVPAPVTPFPYIPWLKFLLWTAYFVGAGYALFRLGQGLLKVRKLYLESPKDRQKGRTLVLPDSLPGTFSFFHTLFLSPADARAADRASVEAHEQAHIRELHSLDVLLSELAGAVWWCMPWFRYWQNAIRENHEYLADSAAARAEGPVAYSRALLARAIAQPAALPVHYFARSKTQKRILMLTQKSNKNRSWTYLFMVPALTIALLIMACAPGAPMTTELPEEGAEEARFAFAGESFPENPAYRDALNQKIERLVANSEYMRKVVLRGMSFRDKVMPLLDQEGLHPDFLYLVMAESGFDPTASSPMGACGLWQFMPKTAENYGMKVSDAHDERLDLVASTRAAAQYLREQKDEFGSWIAAALAFNRGPGALRKTNPEKTADGWFEMDHQKGYLYRLLAMKDIFEHADEYGLATGPAFQLPFGNEVKHDVSSAFGPRKLPASLMEESSPVNDSEILNTSDASMEMPSTRLRGIDLGDITPEYKPQNHNGIDLRAPEGTKIYAISDGVVKAVKELDGKYGNRIIIDHAAPLSSHYNHLGQMHVQPGQQVKQGDLIGTVGLTGQTSGPHLHLEIRENDTPVNPEMYLNF